MYVQAKIYNTPSAEFGKGSSRYQINWLNITKVHHILLIDSDLITCIIAMAMEVLIDHRHKPEHL